MKCERVIAVGLIEVGDYPLLRSHRTPDHMFFVGTRDVDGIHFPFGEGVSIDEIERGLRM